jgi:hypothetical protein
MKQEYGGIRTFNPLFVKIQVNINMFCQKCKYNLLGPYVYFACRRPLKEASGSELLMENATATTRKYSIDLWLTNFFLINQLGQSFCPHLKKVIQ